MLNHDADDLLPSMVGFEQDSVGAGEHRWRSQGYLLADRDLSLGERIHAWVIRERDGRIMKTVSFTADKDNRLVAKWPAAFLGAINSAPVSTGESRYLTAGKFSDSGALEVSATGSPSSKLFSDMTSVKKAEVNRLWYYDRGCRVFTSAPFIANHVIAAQVPGFDLAAGEQLSIQVRDRTSLHLYETFLFAPAGDVRKAAAWPEALCKSIDETNKKPASAYGMLRAGKQGDDKVSVSPGKTGNALWIPQCSNLSVELEPVTWQKYKSVGVFKPTDGAVIQFLVYDRYSIAQLPGSPFSHTVKGSDAAACMTSLASALKASPLGSYLRLGGATADAEPAAASSNLWIMGLPVRVVTLGLPDITSAHEKALENLDGTPLALGELFDKYKDGVRITLCDCWSGQVVHAWVFEPSVADKAAKDAWVRALCVFLSSKFATDAPFVWFGEKTAQSAAPAATDKNVEALTLLIPPEAEMVLHVEPWTPKRQVEKATPGLLDANLIFLRDKLVIEEVLAIGATEGFSGTAEVASYKAGDYYDKLRAWGGFNYLDVRSVVAGLIELEAEDGVQSVMRNDKKRHGLLTQILANSLADDMYAQDVFKDGLGMDHSNILALSASRVSREDVLSCEVELWQLRMPPAYLINECLSCTESSMVLSVTCHQGLSGELVCEFERLRVLTHLRSDTEFTRKRFEMMLMIKRLESLKAKDVPNALELLEAFDITAGTKLRELEYSVTSLALYEELTCEQAEASDRLSEKRSELNLLQEDEVKRLELQQEVDKRHERMKEIDAKIASWRAKENTLATALSGKLKLEFEKALDNSQRPSLAEMLRELEMKATPSSLELFKMLKPFEVFDSIDFISVLRNFLPVSGLPSFTIAIQLLPEVIGSGIRFASSTSELDAVQGAMLMRSRLLMGQKKEQDREKQGKPLWPLNANYRRSGGIHLHIPDGVTIRSNYPLARASYISEAGITHAAASVLTIDPPIIGKGFTPSDSLCADYANTLGSEVYDVSGATENGVDARTGLFHAHYPVGVISGLDGTGPNIDLTLHYSATRANESALGDGWAFRFSSYDNRLHRLTLGTGQTLTLTAAHIADAKDKKRLPINGVTLTDAKGSFDKLTHLTVIFPSGRQEVLAEPGTHDGKEASENYKMAYVRKLDRVRQNLEQWLKERGVSSEDTQKIKDEIKALDKPKADMKRSDLILVPSTITSPQGKKLDLAWEGKEGHVRLNTIRDLTTDLLTATHGAPVASGKYASTFTVWPGTEEEYTVTLDITDCLLSKLIRKGKNDASPTQTVVFGYCGDPVLDRVLNSVAEEDGSLEAVSYVTAWKSWDPEKSVQIPLPRVGRHSLVPGAGQSVISHTWQWGDINNPLQKEGDSFSSTQTLDLGDGVSGPFTRRTWTLKNHHCLETEIVEEVQGVSRTTTRMEYPDEVSGTTLAAQYRWATQPVKVTVTTEDLQTTPPAPAAQETLS